MSDLAELGRYSSSAHANIIRGRLEAVGIPAFCFDEGMNLAEGVPMMFKVRVMVLSEDLQEARQVIADDGHEAPIDEAEAHFDDEPALAAYDSRGRRRRMLWTGFGVMMLPFLVLPLAECTLASN